MSFWDTSSIVPVCLNEPRSQNARRLWRRFADKWVWRETVVEIESAFARLERENLLHSSLNASYRKRLFRLETDWNIIPPTDRQIELARSFPSKYRLKAMDSLQLAAALVWCNEFPKNGEFVSADTQLVKAAREVGFAVHDLS